MRTGQGFVRISSGTHELFRCTATAKTTEGDFAIETDGRDLRVRGARHFRGEGAAYHRLERSYGEFVCDITLPSGVDPDRRRVRLDAGVLTVEIPRGES